MHTEGDAIALRTALERYAFKSEVANRIDADTNARMDP
jgi:hypothetical protein